MKVQILTVLKPEVQNHRFSILLHNYTAKYFIFGLIWISKDEVSSPSGSVCSLPMHINVQRHNCFPVFVLISVIVAGHPYFYVKGCFTCLACKLFSLVLYTTKSLLWTAVSSLALVREEKVPN